MLRKAQYSRERSDYGDYVLITLDEAQNQVTNAEKFVAEIERAFNREIEGKTPANESAKGRTSSS